jgi:hypothetical protein
MTDFRDFGKISRYSREVTVTEKIDGTNGQITITEDGDFLVGSRNRFITPADDNYGFAAWAYENKECLLQLGIGTHFGEWWGQGIQRKYGLTEKRFSLFNVTRWGEARPECCHVVPVLWRGFFDDFNASDVLQQLSETGSHAAPGFMRPEGIIIYHDAGRVYFKKTFEKDDYGKERAQ